MLRLYVGLCGLTLLVIGLAQGCAHHKPQELPWCTRPGDAQPTRCAP